ncbi:histidine phosphatase family protein [Candidatus Poribacteria bacterium]|nr:histidine phosphatase family protein [Candidatus Poribacteria bacterium]
MKTLLILRHAKSSWDDPDLRDYDRPLNKRGKKDAPRMGKLIKDAKLIPDRILSSSAKRARNTAKRFSKACGYTGKIKKLDNLYHAPVGVYFETLQSLQEKYKKILVVGHNPTMEQLIHNLTGQYHQMPTAALAHIQLPIYEWETLSPYTEGTLIDLWTPRTLSND